MSPVSVFLLVIAGILLVAIVGEVLFERTGIPDVIWLMLVGVLVGPVTGLVTRADLKTIAPYFGALTLVVVLFEGGRTLRLHELSSAAFRGSLVACVGFVASVLVLAPVSMLAARMGLLPDSWGWVHGIMLGAILGGSSSVVIMPALAKARIRPDIANVLKLDSALTDVLCVVVTGACVGLALRGDASIGASIGALAKAFGIGIAVGGTAGLMSLLALRRLHTSAYAYTVTLGGLLVLHVIIDNMGGSAALGILTAAVIVGNAPALSETLGLAQAARLGESVEAMHQQITFFVKTFFFTFIGAMLGPPWGYVAFGMLLAVLLLAVRAPAVAIAMAGTGLRGPGRSLMIVSLPRGMAAGVLAMWPYQNGVKVAQHLPEIVFAAVLTTILIFAGGFPIFKKRVALADAREQAEALGRAATVAVRLPEAAVAVPAVAAASFSPSDSAELASHLHPPGDER